MHSNNQFVTAINTTTEVSCPDYIPDFDPLRYIQRACELNDQNQAQWARINVSDIFRQCISTDVTTGDDTFQPTFYKERTYT